MSQKDFDRVLETSASQGVGDVQLAGAVMGYRSLADAGAVDGDTLDLYLEDVFPTTGVPTGAWECGTYTWRTGGILQRTTIRGSSNGGQPVSWGVGLRRVGAGLLAYMVQALRSVGGIQAQVVTVAGVADSVPVVAAHAADVAAVAGAVANVASVAGAIAAVNAVAPRVGDVQALAPNVGAIATVAPKIADVTAVAGNMANVTAVAGNATNINAVATDKANIDLVAGDKVNIDLVAGDLVRIDAVAGNKANIDLVAATKNNIDVVAGAKVNIDTVAGAVANINAVAVDRANIDQVAGSLANVNALAQDLVAIHNIAADLPNIDQVAAIHANVDIVAASAANVNAVAADKANVDLVAGNMPLVQAVGPSVPAIQAVYASLPTIIGSPATASAIAASAAAALQSSQTAIAQAGLAAASAQASASVAQQDLSGATLAALHRSPNAVVQAIIYDTSKDYLGGAWREQCAHLSWMNEPLNGNWLANTSPQGFQSELEARAVGATLAADQVVNGNFAGGGANWTGPASFTFSGGKLVITNAASNDNIIQNTGALTVGLHLVTITVDSITSGAVRAQIESNVGFQISAPGTYTSVVACAAAASRFFIRALGVTNAVVSSMTSRPITAFNTKSGDFYQLATDGKFYRLFTNLLANSDLPFADGRAVSAVRNGTNLYANAGSASTIAYYSWNGAGLNGNGGLFQIMSGAQYTISFVGEQGSFTGTPSVCLIDSAGTILSNQVAVPLPATGAGGARQSVTVTATGNSGNGQFRISGVTTGQTILIGATQVALTLDPAAAIYEPKGAGNSQIETFRGNTAKFPRMAAVVVETGAGGTAFVTIYALDQPGRPMWMRFAGLNGGWINTPMLSPGGGALSCVTALNSTLCIGGTGADSGITTIEFAKDRAVKYHASPAYGGVYSGNIAQRNAATGRYTNGAPTFNPTLVSAVVNAVAMMVRPTAPADPVTGLPVPVIAAATNGGVSVLVEDGTTANLTNTNTNYTYARRVAFDKRGRLAMLFCYQGIADDSYLHVVDVPTASVAINNQLNAYTTLNGEAYRAVGTTPALILGKGAASALTGATVMTDGDNLAYANNSGITKLRRNPSNQGAGLAAQITGTYNTGWMPGDIRRAMFIDCVVGVADGVSGNIVGNGSFNTDVAGWQATNGNGGAASIAWQAPGMMRVTGTVNNDRGERAIPLVAGQAYEIFVTVTVGTAGVARVNLIRGSAGNYAFIAGNANITSSGTYRITAVAPVTESGLIQCAVGAAGYVDFDDVIVRPIAGGVVDRSSKASLNTRINGSLAATAVAAASQMVAWGGFSNDPTFFTEKVANGTFTTDTSGWTAAGVATATSTAGQGVFANLGLTNDYVTQAVTGLAPGVSYVWKRDVVASGGAFRFSLGTAAKGSSLQDGFVTGAGLTTTFVAPANGTVYISAYSVSGTASVTVDNVSILPASTSAIGSAANVAQEPWSADHDPALAAFGGSAWFNVPATGFGPGNFMVSSEDLNAVVFNRTGVTVTLNVDGTADKVARQVGVAGYWSAIAANGALTMPAVSGSFNYTVRAKAGAVGGRIGLRIQGTYPNRVDALFDLTTGALVGTANGGTASGAAATIQAAPGAPGYYDMTVTGTLADAFSQVLFSPCDATSVTTGGWEGSPSATTAAEVIVARQQVGRGLVSYPYVATTGTAYNGIAPIYDRSASTGAYYRWGVDANGMLACELSDGTTVRRVTTTQAVNTGTPIKGEFAYVPNGASTTLTLKVNAVQQVQSTFAALLTMNNANALLTWGQARTLDAAFPGVIDMAKLSMTIPTAEQSAWMYAQELPMFNPGAQVTLADTGNLLDMAYDSMENSLTVASATAKSKFVGLVRTHSETPAAGSFAGVGHTSGIKLLTRTGTNPGVDITLPSQNLKEELLRRAEDAGRAMAAAPRVFDFDAAANQSDFQLPVGWEAVEVIVARSSQREGAAKDWVRKFDGFRETPSLATQQALNTWVQIIARRAA